MKISKKSNGRFTAKGDFRMRISVKEKEPEKLTCMADMKKMIQQAIKEKGLTKEQVIKSFGLNRYEK